MFRTVPTIVALLAAISLVTPQNAGAQAGAVTDVQIAPPTVSLAVGQRTSAFATAYNARGEVVATTRITWSTSSPGIVRVEVDSTSPEVVTLIGVAAGAAVVEARVGNRRGLATVQVGGAGGQVATQGGAGSFTSATVSAGNAAVIKLEPTALYLLPGESGKLAPVFLKDDGTPAAPTRLTWKTLVPAVANVDADGGVVGIAPGQGLIEASVGPLAARVPVVVTLTNIAITRRMATMSPGAFDTLVVIVPEQKNRLLPPTAFQWRSGDETVARVSPFGVVNAVGGGRTEILVSGFLQEVRVPVTVHKRVEFLRLSPPARMDTVRLPLGSTQRFVAEPQAMDQTPVPEATVSWRLLDTSVVAFDPSTGMMTAKRVGTTKLRVSVGGSGLDTAWTVSVVAGGVKFGTHLLGLGTGERAKVAASFVDEAGQPITQASGLRWSSSAPQVAQVDADGTVNATGFGRASIIGASTWGRADTLTVLVQGELLVSSTRGGTWDLYALDRRAPTVFNRLTSFPSTEVNAVYGPGGTTIVYVSSNDNNQDLYALEADGAKPARLTSTPAQEDAPDVTPDGKQVVYASNATGSYQVWIMNIDGSEQKRLTEGPGLSFQPSVSPDGRTIAFVSNREGNYDVYQMNLDGTNPRSVLKTPTREMSPQWLPNGHIAFLQEQRAGLDRKGPVVNVVVKRDAATGQLSNLTPLSHNVSDFAVSSQGDFLALVATAAGQGGNTPGRLFLLPIVSGATPTEVPLSIPKEQVFSPSFRK